MNNEQIIEKLKEWVISNYNKNATAYTSERSFGNFDDCFEDGMTCQRSWDAYEIGLILGMDLEDPKEPEYVY